MSKVFKKVIVVVLSLAVLLGFTACGEIKSKVNENAPQAPITAEWTYDHLVSHGEYVPRYIFISDKNNPHFSSDGSTYTINIVPDKEYTGEVEKIDDCNYRLHSPNSDKSVDVFIAGNSLTVKIDDEHEVVFVAKK